MNVLLLILDHDEIRYAVLPLKIIREYNYKAIDGMVIGKHNISSELEEQIMELFDRLGLEDGLPKRQRDLKKYLHAQPPFRKINFVVRIGWLEE